METAPFFGQTMARLDLGWSVVSLERYAPGELGEHRHSGVCAFVLLSGQHQDATDWTRVEQRPATTILRPAESRHSTLIGPLGMVGINIAWTKDGALDDCDRYSLISGHAVRCAAVRLAVALRTGKAVEESTWELTAAMAGPPTKSSAWIDDVVAAVDCEQSSLPSLSGLADLAGVHPVTLCRAFRQSTGVTYTEYVAGIRAASVCGRVLAGQGVGESCVEAGFADHAHGTRTFRRIAGAPPAVLC